MLKQGSGFLKKANIISDAGLLIAAFLAAFNLRVQFGGLDVLDSYTWVLLIVVPVWLVLLERYGFYNSQRMSTPWSILKSLAQVTAIGGVLTSSLIFLCVPHGFSRSFFGTFLVISFLLLVAEQFLVRTGLRLLRMEGYNYRNVLVVGTDESAEKILDILDRNRGWGLKIVGLLGTRPVPDLETQGGHRVIGTLADVVEICKTQPVDEVIFCDSKEDSWFQFADYITM